MSQKCFVICILHAMTRWLLFFGPRGVSAMRMLYMVMKADRTMCLDLARKTHLTSHAMENAIGLKIIIIVVFIWIKYYY